MNLKVDEAQARMEEIQRIMERATLFTLLPGTPAILGGLMVLAGCAVSYGMFRSLDFGDIVNVSVNQQVLFCLMWLAIGVVGIVMEVAWTTAAAKKQQLGPSDRPLRVAAFSLTPSVFVAVVLTAKFLLPVDARVWQMISTLKIVPLMPTAQEIQYIVPVWMMLYGTGVYTAGLFSIRPPRVLGLTFIAMGAIALLCVPQYGVLTAALSFGLLHIVFGVYILRHQRRVAR